MRDDGTTRDRDVDGERDQTRSIERDEETETGGARDGGADDELRGRGDARGMGGSGRRRGAVDADAGAAEKEELF
jgi:hypothetical protein